MRVSAGCIQGTRTCSGQRFDLLRCKCWQTMGRDSLHDVTGTLRVPSGSLVQVQVRRTMFEMRIDSPGVASALEQMLKRSATSGKHDVAFP